MRRCELLLRSGSLISGGDELVARLLRRANILCFSRPHANFMDINDKVTSGPEAFVVNTYKYRMSQ